MRLQYFSSDDEWDSHGACAASGGSAVDVPAEAFGAAELLVISRLFATRRPLFMAKLTFAVSPTARSSSVADLPSFRTDVEGSADRIHTFPLRVRTCKLGDAAARSSAAIEPSIEMSPSFAGTRGLAVVTPDVLGSFAGGGAFGLAGSRARDACGRLVGCGLGTAVRLVGLAVGLDMDGDVPDAGRGIAALDPTGAIVDLMTVIFGASGAFWPVDEEDVVDDD